jgi:aquaporin Z
LEAVGNFVLVFAFGAAIATHNWFAPLVIGVALMAVIGCNGRLPGGHYNPALTLAMLIRRRLTVPEALTFWIVQSCAGLLAAATVCAMVGPEQLAITASITVQGLNLGAALAVELVFTCVLCCVALDVSPRGANAVDEFRSWPTVFGATAGAVGIGAISAGAFDLFGIHDAVLGIISWPTLWVYLISRLLSGIATTITFLSLSDQY